MLVAEYRLRKSAAIATAMKRGKRCTSEHLVVHVQTEAASHTRFAFAVGKNVGNSVVRHRVTRQLRHIVASQVDSFPQGAHVVVRALPSASKASFSSLAASFDQAVRKVGPQ